MSDITVSPLQKKKVKITDYYTAIQNALARPQTKQALIEIVQLDYKINRNQIVKLIRDLQRAQLISTTNINATTYYCWEGRIDNNGPKGKVYMMKDTMEIMLSVTGKGSLSMRRGTQARLLAKVGKKRNTPMLMRLGLKEIQVDGIWYECKRSKNIED